jgi:NADP-dependent 3-hydroxy acid dehydrogenase YdfG
MENVTDKVVVITGASSGFGERAARHLASLGAKVVLGARRTDRLTNIVRDITEAGGDAVFATTDVTRRDNVKALVNLAITSYGRLDVIINNAGIMPVAPLDADKVEEWDAMIDVNIRGVLHGISAALPVFRKQNSGHFINLSSIAGMKVPTPGGVVYAATKFAVRAISEGLRVEAGPNIRTTTLLPGLVESELKFGSSDPDAQAAVLGMYESAIPTQTIADAIVYAIAQPKSVDINEIVVRPTSQEF